MAEVQRIAVLSALNRPATLYEFIDYTLKASLLGEGHDASEEEHSGDDENNQEGATKVLSVNC